MSQKYGQDDFHDDMFKERRRNPLVLVGVAPSKISNQSIVSFGYVFMQCLSLLPSAGAAATAGVLCAGLLAFKQVQSMACLPTASILP